MSKGISNLEIENFFENEENQDLKNNYMGVYSIDSIARYINFYEIKKKEMETILLQFLILISTINQAGIGGVLWIFIQEKNLLLFDSQKPEPDEKSKIINHETLNKKTIEEILNEIFSTDVDENKQEMENFRKEYDL